MLAVEAVVFRGFIGLLGFLSRLSGGIAVSFGGIAVAVIAIVHIGDLVVLLVFILFGIAHWFSPLFAVSMCRRMCGYTKKWL